MASTIGRYNLREQELPHASILECWMYWLLHAHEYEPEGLQRLFPQEAIRQATQTITRVAAVTEDKAMYDAREKAIRDQQWALNASRNEGKIEGKIELIHTLEEILNFPATPDSKLLTRSLEELQTLTVSLQERIRNRNAS